MMRRERNPEGRTALGKFAAEFEDEYRPGDRMAKSALATPCMRVRFPPGAPCSLPSRRQQMLPRADTLRQIRRVRHEHGKAGSIVRPGGWRRTTRLAVRLSARRTRRSATAPWRSHCGPWSCPWPRSERTGQSDRVRGRIAILSAACSRGRFRLRCTRRQSSTGYPC